MRVLARLIEQVVEYAESLDGKRAGRFQEHLGNARPMAPDKRISTPCFHAMFPLAGSVRGERARSGVDAGLLKLPQATTKCRVCVLLNNKTTAPARLA
jgi:hypothetical protein